MSLPKLRTMIRVIPPTHKDMEREDMVTVTSDRAEITLLNPSSYPKREERKFEFDKIFMPDTSQDELFDTICKPIIPKVLEGRNTCIFLYGKNGSGKSHSAFGQSKQRGLVPRIVNQLYRDVGQLERELDISVCMYEIINGTIKDLGVASTSAGNPSYHSQDLQVSEDPTGSVKISGISAHSIENVQDLIAIIDAGFALRQQHDTGHNDSFSHTFVTIAVKQNNTTSFINIVDLAASDLDKLVGEKSTDFINVNSELTVLNKVILALYTETPFIPYRDSKLTRVLQNSLTENSYTTLIAHIDPSECHYEDCLKSVMYANRCRNTDIVPEVTSAAVRQDIISSSKGQKRIMRLQEELIDLKNRVDTTNGQNEKRLKELTAILGIESLDTDVLLSSHTASQKDIAMLTQQREAAQKSEHLKNRNRELEKRLADYKVLYEEYKRVDINNREKNEREIEVLREELENLREEMDSTKEKSEHGVREQLQNRAEELQRLLTHSHMLLEEKAAVIHNLPFTMQSQSADAKNLADMRDLGRSEVEHEFRKRYRENEINHQRQMANLKEQYEYMINDREKEIARFLKEFEDYSKGKKAKTEKLQAETKNLYEIALKQNQLIQNIEDGVYNNGIRPVLIPQDDRVSTPNREKFRHLFRYLESKKILIGRESNNPIRDMYSAGATKKSFYKSTF